MSVYHSTVRTTLHDVAWFDISVYHTTCWVAAVMAVLEDKQYLHQQLPHRWLTEDSAGMNQFIEIIPMHKLLNQIQGSRSFKVA